MRGAGIFIVNKTTFVGSVVLDDKCEQCIKKFTFFYSVFLYIFFLLRLIYAGSYFCITNLNPLLISGKDSRQ